MRWVDRKPSARSQSPLAAESSGDEMAGRPGFLGGSHPTGESEIRRAFRSGLEPVATVVDESEEPAIVPMRQEALDA